MKPESRATAADLEARIDNGAFRRLLLHRLAGYQLGLSHEP